jgi:hypothetical protein
MLSGIPVAYSRAATLQRECDTHQERLSPTDQYIEWGWCMALPAQFQLMVHS